MIKIMNRVDKLKKFNVFVLCNLSSHVLKLVHMHLNKFLTDTLKNLFYTYFGERRNSFMCV